MFSILIWSAYLFERVDFLGFAVAGLEDFSEGALADLVQDFELIEGVRLEHI